MVFWKCKSHEDDRYLDKFEYIQEPSADLIETFKIEIIQYQEPKNHESYVQCDDVERSKGLLLFILKSRVEIMIRPDYDTGIIWFVNCDEVY